MTEQIPINEPSLKKGFNRYEFSWDYLGITAVCDRVDQDGTGELSVHHKNGHGDQLILHKNINLLSMQSCSQIAKQLKTKTHPEIDWDCILTWITNGTLTELRKGQPLVEIGNEPTSMKTEYLLKPLLEKGVCTTLFAPGSSGKSYIADYIAVLLQNGVEGLQGNWCPIQSNVLYLDWEANADIHNRRVWAIKKGMLLDGELNTDLKSTFKYQRLTMPLVDCVQTIQHLVKLHDIQVIIVDSYMAAQDGGLDQNQSAQRFYNALESVNCTCLVIDHISKEEWKGNSETVASFGAVSKYNRSRAQFQLVKEQNLGEPFIKLVLKHKKNNNGLLRKDFGIRIDFANALDNEDKVEAVVFTTYDVIDDAQTTITQPTWERIRHAILTSGGKLTTKVIAKKLDISSDTVRMECNRLPSIFVSLGKLGKETEWGIVAKNG